MDPEYARLLSQYKFTQRSSILHQMFWVDSRCCVPHSSLYIYEFRCFDYGDCKNVRSAAELMRHHDRIIKVPILVNDAGKNWPLANVSICMKLGVKPKTSLDRRYRAERDIPLTGNINAITSIVLSVQRITEIPRTTVVSFAKININAKQMVLMEKPLVK